jgi:hypothetical protein
VNYCFQTFSGRLVNPLRPKPEDIALEDIAHALGHVCRFGGHCAFLFPVGLHSLNVSLMVEQLSGSVMDSLWGLLHDATEAYLGDMVRPLKHQPEMAPYREAEAKLQTLICNHFELPHQEPALVREVDRRMCITEGPIVFEGSVRLWNEEGNPYKREEWPDGMMIEPLPHAMVVRMFLKRFQYLDSRLDPHRRAAR